MTDISQPTVDPAGIERTPTGEIAPQTPTPEPTSTPTPTETTPEPKAKSVLNDDKPTGAPDKYEAFTLPEGFEANEELMTEASAIFKELNLPQAAAQQLVNFYAKQAQHAAEAPMSYWLDMQKQWGDQIKADPNMGHRLPQIKANLGRMLDSLGDAKLANDFREAMDLTGAGNHPAFARVMDLVSQKLVEGAHVAGNAPAPVRAPGAAERPSLASAMYPNLGQPQRG